MEISFSQAGNWDTCKRSWAYSKVDGLRGIPNKVAIRGVRYHEAIEQHIVDGERSANPIVQDALDSLYGLKDVVAEKFVEDYRGNHHFRGFADVVADGVVLDWKFPVRDPGGQCRDKYRDQLNLYAFLLGSSECRVVLPEYGREFIWEADVDAGARVLDWIYGVADEIEASGALGVGSLMQEASPNGLCLKWCGYRDLCEFGGLYVGE